jgi:hypothetical protein
MAFWRFMAYVTDDSTDPMKKWYDSQDAEVRVAFDATLFTLAATEDWTHRRVKSFKILTGAHSGLCELRFTVEPQPRKKRRFRPLGVWRKDSRDFILLGGSEKSGRILIPPNAFDLALLYKAEFEAGKGKIYEYA